MAKWWVCWSLGLETISFTVPLSNQEYDTKNKYNNVFIKTSCSINTELRVWPAENIKYRGTSVALSLTRIMKILSDESLIDTGILSHIYKQQRTVFAKDDERVKVKVNDISFVFFLIW